MDRRWASACSAVERRWTWLARHCSAYSRKGIWAPAGSMYSPRARSPRMWSRKRSASFLR